MSKDVLVLAKKTLKERYGDRWSTTRRQIKSRLIEAWAMGFCAEERVVRVTPMLLWCPECGERHIDEGEFADKVHHTHACQHCGHVWRPAVEPTTGVRFLPGFKNA